MQKVVRPPGWLASATTIEVKQSSNRRKKVKQKRYKELIASQKTKKSEESEANFVDWKESKRNVKFSTKI